MAMPGPIPILPPSPSQNAADGHLRVNQRITAGIVEISGTRAIISIEGYPIVARLENADQGARLAGQRMGHFIVASANNGEIVLRLLSTAPNEELKNLTGALNDVAMRVLNDLHIPNNDESLLLARALLSQHLAITADGLAELKGFLDSLGGAGWTEPQALLAAAMKANGLPLTPGLFQALSQAAQPISEAIPQIFDALQAALQNGKLNPESKQAINQALNFLRDAAPPWAQLSHETAGQLRSTAEIFGRSFENMLFSHAAGLEEGSDKAGLLPLVQVQQQLEAAGEKTLAGQVASFLRTVEQNQVNNLRLNPVPGQGEWCEMSFMLRKASGDPKTDAAQQPFYPVRLRVARREGRRNPSIDPQSTRMLVQVDLSPTETIQVDLSLAGKQIRADVLAPNESLRARSQEEMPALAERLNALGYVVRQARVQVGVALTPPLLAVQPLDETTLRGINVKI